MSEVLDATGDRQASSGTVSALPRTSRFALSPEALRREAPRLAMLAVVVVLPILVLDARWLSFAVITGMWGLAALGLGLILGYGGQISIGHAALIAVGGYTAGLVTRELNWGYGLSLVAAVVMATAVAFVTLPILRLRGNYLALATLALGFIVERLLINWDDLTGGPSGLTDIPTLGFGTAYFTDDRAWWVLVVVAIYCAQLLIRRMVTGKTGRAIAVLHEDEDLMPALRMNATRLKARLFLIGSAMAGLAGALLAHRVGFLAPEQFGIETSILLALAVLLGGATSWWGPLIGAGVLRIFPEVFLETPHLRGVLIPAIVIALVFLAPEGVSGLLSRVGGAVSGVLPLRARKKPELGDEHWQAVLEGRQTAFDRGLAQGQTILEVESVSKSFGGLEVLKDVSLDVHRGEIVGLIGPNGAGKTTLLNMIAGQLQPDSGSIRYSGQHVEGLSPLDHRRSGMVRTFQTPRLVNRLSVLANVRAGADALFPEKASEAISRLELSRLRLSDVVELPPSELPFGGLRGVEFSRSFVMLPELLLLDEPAAGLGADDLEVLDGLLDKCAGAGIAVILVEHNMEFLASAVGRIVALANGVVIASGDPESVLANRAVIEQYLGAETEIEAEVVLHHEIHHE